MKGSRYGRRIRKLSDTATKRKKDSYECPKCGKRSVKRISYALWECRSCGARIAGGAYTLTTPTANTARKMLAKEEAGEE
ncbi:MAG: 50S ribosomal protein L37ae [Candidatus Micrarchaeia archaeon]